MAYCSGFATTNHSRRSHVPAPRRCGKQIDAAGWVKGVLNTRPLLPLIDYWSVVQRTWNAGSGALRKARSFIAIATGGGYQFDLSLPTCAVIHKHRCASS